MYFNFFVKTDLVIAERKKEITFHSQTKMKECKKGKSFLVKTKQNKTKKSY